MRRILPASCTHLYAQLACSFSRWLHRCFRVLPTMACSNRHSGFAHMLPFSGMLIVKFPSSPSEMCVFFDWQTSVSGCWKILFLSFLLLSVFMRWCHSKVRRRCRIIFLLWWPLCKSIRIHLHDHRHTFRRETFAYWRLRVWNKIFAPDFQCYVIFMLYVYACILFSNDFDAVALLLCKFLASISLQFVVRNSESSGCREIYSTSEDN